MGRIDEDGNPRPAGGFSWVRLAVNSVCFTAMYVIGFYCGRQDSRPPAAVVRPAPSGGDNFAAVVERTARTEAAGRGETDLIPMWLEADSPDGNTTVEKAIDDAGRLAARLRCGIRMKYRGRTLLVAPWRKKSDVLKMYLDGLEEDAGR
jgi:hypothetical protein